MSRLRTVGDHVGGTGSNLAVDLEQIALRLGGHRDRRHGDAVGDTVRFHLGRGYRLMAQPLPELLKLEPDDIHMSKVL